MFEKEAEDSFNGKKVLYKSSTDKRSYIDGFKDGYNKANEWHFIKNRDFPVREDYYVIACHSATGDYTDRCQWFNNEWWNADGEVRHFINEKVYAWKEKSQPPEEI